MATIDLGYDPTQDGAELGLVYHASHSVLAPRVGYDLVATEYDSWKWQSIWHQFEWPIILDMLAQAYRVQAGSMLDIGTGTGTYLRAIVDKFAPRRAVGIDVSQNMLTQAARKLAGTDVRLQTGDALNLNFPSDTFDAVLMCRVASHIDDVDLAAREAFRVLRPGGYMIMSDIHSDHPYEFTRIPFGRLKINIETYRHSVEDWLRVAQKVNFRTRCLRTIRSSPIKVAAKLSDLPNTLLEAPDHDVAFVLLAQKPIHFQESLDHS